MDCLTTGDLARYHADEVAPEERERMGAHLAACAACAARDQQLQASHDDLIARLRSAGRPPESGADRKTYAPPSPDGYSLRGEIDRGGQGIVYRALQESTQREVAIKVLRDGLDASPAAQRRFTREVEAIAGLRHPGVVQVFDSGTLPDGRRFIVMDYVDGLPLHRYVRQQQCDLATRLRLFAKLCDAVHHAHQRGVIHRDLKPSNILVDADGQPCVLDFGLARQVEADRGQTLTGHVAGTLAYLSPEQARGLPDAIDVRSDVYTLGVMLFELLTGTSPYPVDRDTVEVLQAIAEQSPGSPLKLVAEGLSGLRMPDDLETIVRSALAKDRERRYQTAAALAADLRSFESGDPIAARRDSGWYLLRMLIRRYRTIVSLGMTLLVVSVVSAVGLGWLYSEQRAQRQLAEDARAVADERFERLRQLSLSFIIDVDPMLEQLPGAAEARAYLAAKGLDYLDLLRKEAPQDPQLAYELALAYATVGSVLGDLNSASLDDLPGAVVQFEIAREMCLALLARADAPTQTPMLHHRVLLRLAAIRLEERDTARAVALLTEAEQRARDLHATNPKHLDYIRVLADTYDQISNMHVANGDVEQAEAAIQESLRFGQQQVALVPDDLMAKRGVGVSLTKLAQFALERGDLDQALAQYGRFREITAEVLAAQPHHRAVQRDWAVAEEWHCILLTMMNRSDEALPFCVGSVEAADALLAIEPASRELREALSSKLTKLIEALLKSKQVADVPRYLARLDAVADSLVADSSDRGAAARMRGVAWYKHYEYHKALSLDRARTLEQRQASLLAARTCLRTCRQVFLDAREAGTLLPSDAGLPDTLSLELTMLQTTVDSMIPDAP